ncbi:MAG: hypothetical protein NTX15_01430 [Candidatus Kapabacteria bacterium]|nr:hypothetical protein [Candidatus Kapabacteria bacterium]
MKASLLLAVFIMLSATSQRSIAQDGKVKPTILIQVDMEGDDTLGMSKTTSNIYSRAKALAKEYFPCAKVYTKEDLNAAIDADRIRSLGSSENNLDVIAAQMMGRYSLNFSVRKTDEGFNLKGNVIDHKKWDVMDGSFEMGASNSLDDMIERAIERLSLTEVCPWIGTVSVTRKYKRDSSYSVPSSRNEIRFMAKITSVNEQTDVWEFTKVGRTRAKGSVTTSCDRSNKEERNVAGNIPCMRSPDGGCNIVDELIPGTLENILVESANVCSGSLTFDDAKIEVTIDPKQGRYFITVKQRGAMIAGGKSFERETFENSCRKCVVRDVQGIGYAFVTANWVVGDPYKKKQKVLKGRTPIPDENETVEVSWDLHK